jgi:hypothetical protein
MAETGQVSNEGGGREPGGPADQGHDARTDAHVWQRGYAWSTGRGGFPWLGLLLVALGAALVVEQGGTGVSTGHALALFVGLVFWLAFLVGAGWSGLIAAVLTGWGLARVLGDLGYVSGDGWTALLIGAGFLAVYLVGLARAGGRHGWALWVGLALVLLGAVQVAVHELPGLPPLDAYVVPGILIVIGAFLVFRAVRPR